MEKNEAGKGERVPRWKLVDNQKGEDLKNSGEGLSTADCGEYHSSLKK